MGQVPQLRQEVFEKRMSVGKRPESNQKGPFPPAAEGNRPRRGEFPGTAAVNWSRQTPPS